MPGPSGTLDDVRNNDRDAWFQLGRITVTTTTLAVGVLALGMIVASVVPGLPAATYFSPTAIASGQAWRLITWPFAAGLSLLGALNLVMFWFFGTELERGAGLVRMGWLLVGLWASVTAAYAGAALLLGGGGLAGPSLLSFVLMLIWVAENPRRPMFFTIPAWVVGVVLAGINVLSLIGVRDWPGLVALLVAFCLSAMAARNVGLLSDYGWIPGGPSVRSPTQRAPRPSAAVRRETARVLTDAQRIDELLDKISQHGLHSLTDSERKELNKLRERRNSR